MRRWEVAPNKFAAKSHYRSVEFWGARKVTGQTFEKLGSSKNWPSKLLGRRSLPIENLNQPCGFAGFRDGISIYQRLRRNRYQRWGLSRRRKRHAKKYFTFISRDTKPNAIWPMELGTSRCHSDVGPKPSSCPCTVCALQGYSPETVFKHI